MNPGNGLGEELRGIEHPDLFLEEPGVEPERGNGVGDEDLVHGRLGEHAVRVSDEDAVGGRGEDFPRAELATRLGRPEERGDVTGGHGVPGLGLPILSRIGEIGNHGGDASGGGIAKSAKGEEEPRELVVHAMPGVAVQRFDHEDVVSSNVDEWAGFVLAVLELPFLVRRQRDAKLLAHVLSEGPLRGRRAGGS